MAPPPTASGARSMSRCLRGSPRTAGSKSGPESKASGRGWKRHWRRSPANVSGIDPADVHVKLGDTELSPYSSGAWGSRGIVWAGGATARACKELARAGGDDRRGDAADRCQLRRRFATAACSVPRQRFAERHRARILSGAVPICPAISIRMDSKSPAAMRRAGSPACIPDRPMPRSLPSIRKPAASKSSTTSWWKTPAS